MTFKATWMIKVETLKYTITFDTNGGDNISPLVVQFKSEVKLSVPTRRGYKFTGWMEENQIVNQTYQVTKNVTLTATLEETPWVDAYVVWLNLNDGSPDVIHYVKENTYFHFPTPTRDGYTFIGWEYEGELVGESCYAVINQDDSNTSGITNSVIFSILHDLQYPINKLINKNKHFIVSFYLKIKL